MATLTLKYVHDFICYVKLVYFMLFQLSDPKTDWWLKHWLALLYMQKTILGNRISVYNFLILNILSFCFLNSYNDIRNVSVFRVIQSITFR